MRGVSRWASRVAPLLAVLLVFTASGVRAEGAATPPTDSPQARLGPPGGVTTQARLQPPSGIMPPPPLDDTTQARVSPPVGAPTSIQVSLLNMIRIWLQSLRTPDV
ncbi:MAG: hypothetical protein QOH21_1405 [Acidobacteriota bacterium]|jgi:hypothetical protein|nr:hypothetical protein [Acidobacteriota bacterium]